MDDLQEKLSRLLQDPKTMEQVKGLSEMLGFSGQNTSAPQEKEEKHNENDFPIGDVPQEAIQTVAKLIPMLNSIKTEDEATRLLLALRPFLKEERQQKLDQAKKMLQLIKILPMIKNANLF